MTSRFIRIREVCACTGLSRSTLYRLEAEGLFPRRVKIAKRSVAYREAEILGWIESRAKADYPALCK